MLLDSLLIATCLICSATLELKVLFVPVIAPIVPLPKALKVVASATLAAIRPISGHKVNPEIRGFETPSSTDQGPMIGQYIFSPNLYVDITKQWAKKLNGLKIYRDELRGFPHARSIKAIEALAIKRGSESGLELAEAFTLYRKIYR